MDNGSFLNIAEDGGPLSPPVDFSQFSDEVFIRFRCVIRRSCTCCVYTNRATGTKVTSLMSRTQVARISCRLVQKLESSNRHLTDLTPSISAQHSIRTAKSDLTRNLLLSPPLVRRVEIRNKSADAARTAGS
ncbi:hypothetical protein EVAR_45238_1 [Eumeta japonica]|uniref:Uncharacterized protein n=1 Tax=Eumeta variegata TaxID=151549 RepID=A0A4C1XDP2_EUMVA|nr:hypothetical protein EVAR_45238_1 [Eumeta japonica]